MEMLWPGQDTDRFHGGVAYGLLEQLYVSDPSYTVCQALNPPLRDTSFFLNIPTFITFALSGAEWPCCYEGRVKLRVRAAPV